MEKKKLLQIRGIGEKYADKILKCLEEGKKLSTILPVKLAKLVESAKDEKKWTKVTDMTLINFLKNQIRSIKGSLSTSSAGYIVTKGERFWLSTYRGKNENSWLSSIYKNGKKLPMYLLSFENKTDKGEFLNVGKVSI